ncbi:RNA polymerase sigma factor [Alkalicoccus chagannorensis]|uniref:RNA polymerase sigma factor n=1 Tax=Alkalicoccus chagannorensis TaxID=427072 RepID=UPI0004034539|nr:sigma-70 family RNA polymerase sigma factor [Alkalicoccus chagannorensis]
MQPTKKLVRELRRGRWDRLLDWMETKETMLFRLGASRLKRTEDIEDALHNAIVQAVEKIEQLREPAYFETWFIRIYLHECTAVYRRNTSVPMNEAVQSRAAVQEEGFGQVELADMLEPLEPEERDWLLLQYTGGYTYEEIAAAYQTSASAVKSKVHRARAAIRQQEARAYDSQTREKGGSGQ